MSEARWIWRGGDEIAPQNQFTWFRKVIELRSPPETAEIRFAADTAAQLWVNGVLVKRKVTRFHEPNVRADVVNVARHLRAGTNVIVALHHSWGNIVTFQRTGQTHSGIYLDASWIVTDETWRWKHADEFEGDAEQFAGVADGTHRIRYPIRWNATLGEDPSRYHSSDFNDSPWAGSVTVHDGPWPERLLDVETPAQRESAQIPMGLLAAGTVTYPDMNVQRGSRLARAVLRPESLATASATGLIRGEPYTVVGLPGETHYVTLDMHRPVHGYPFVDLECGAHAEFVIGYGELPLSPHSGRALVTSDGWIDVDGVVAHDYSDTLWPSSGRRTYEIPDERTARWITVHISFAEAGSVTIHRLGFIKSQYPIETRGSFECGDERLDQIVKLGIVHAEITMSDAYVDTPGREDGQWVEDARDRAILAARWFGDTRLRRLMIRTLAEGQDDQGNLHPFFPSNYPYGPSQWDWSLQWIGMVADDYLWTADKEFLATHFSSIERMWEAITPDIGDDGVWRNPHVFGDIRTSAPLANGDSSGIVTPWVIDRLRDSAELAEVVGRHELVDPWRDLAHHMTQSFRKEHLSSANPLGVRLVADSINKLGTPSGFSQAGQITPLNDGILSTIEATAVIDAAFPAPNASPPRWLPRWNNPTWAYRVLRALSVHGLHERALAHLIERYSPYLPGHPDNEVDPLLQGPYGGPLPEYWVSRRDLDLTAGELSHRQPADPTGSHGWGAMPLLWLHEYLLGVTIADPGGSRLAVRPVSAGLPFVSGTTITPRGIVYLHFEPSEPRLSLEIPEGATAVLWLPAEFTTTQVRESRNRIALPEPRDTVTLGAGHWEFVGIGARW